MWSVQDICKNKLSEKDGNSILGYSILKTRFSITLEKRSFLMKFLDKIDNLNSQYKEHKKSKMWRVSNTLAENQKKVKQHNKKTKQSHKIKTTSLKEDRINTWVSKLL